MKKRKILIVFLLVVLNNSAAIAQRGKVKKLTEDNYIAFSETQAAHLHDSLHLSAEQTVEVKKIFSELGSAAVAINEGATLSPTNRKAQMKSLDDKKEAALKNVLTHEQYKQYHALIKRINDRVQILRATVRTGK